MGHGVQTAVFGVCCFGKMRRMLYSRWDFRVQWMNTHIKNTCIYAHVHAHKHVKPHGSFVKFYATNFIISWDFNKKNRSISIRIWFPPSSIPQTISPTVVYSDTFLRNSQANKAHREILYAVGWLDQVILEVFPILDVSVILWQGVIKIYWYFSFP